MTFRRCFTAIAAACLPAVAFAQAGAPDQRSGPSTPVQVQNTSANPVPVTGSVTVSGSSSVTVENAVSVINEDNPALQPITVKYQVQLNSATVSNGRTALSFYEVPAGKRLVIEQVDGNVVFDPISNTVKTYWSLIVFNAGSETEHFLGVTAETAPCTLTQTCAGISKGVRIYADPGAKLQMFCGYSATAAPVIAPRCSGTVNGYLVDIP